MDYVSIHSFSLRKNIIFWVLLLSIVTFQYVFTQQNVMNLCCIPSKTSRVHPFQDECSELFTILPSRWFNKDLYSCGKATPNVYSFFSWYQMNITQTFKTMFPTWPLYLSKLPSKSLWTSNEPNFVALYK